MAFFETFQNLLRRMRKEGTSPVTRKKTLQFNLEPLEVREVPAAGPVAAFNFDEAAGSVLRDLSGNGNHGTITRATWAPGKFGSALAFNGTNAMVSVPDSNSLDLTRSMTLEAWVK